ncbi:MAG: type II toxin-antitoxin system RelE family toxin [Desulfobacteraceae bacterium]
MSYAVRLTGPAAKALESLDQTTLKRLQARIDELAHDPFSPRISKPLKTAPGRRSSRIGGWRLIYQVNENEHLVFITAILPRQAAYRKL